MNNYFDNTVCSRTSVERYLLNRMTAGEETLFQEHLCTCNTCRDYLNALRNVAGIIHEESPETSVLTLKKPAVATRKKKPATVFPLSVNMRRIMLAACLIPACAIILYRFLHEPGIPHDTQIMLQNKASVEYADTLSLTEGTVIELDTLYLLFPAQPVSTVNPAREEIIFRWNRESDYQLRLEANGKTVVTIDSTGMACTIDSSLAVRYEQLDWTLILEGKELKGRLYIQSKM